MLSLKKVKKNIYCLNFDDPYDAAMYFLRYQEYYESIENKGKSLPLIDLMDVYSHKYGNGCFTYTNDWAGYNIPGYIIFEVNKKGIEDFNRYDAFMLSIAEAIKLKCNDDFYLIGTSTKEKSTYYHELAHGLFYTNKQYRDKMEALFHELPSNIQKFIKIELAKDQYHESVHVDEAQAYMATGLTDRLHRKKALQKYRKPFKDIFKKYAGVRALKND